jgi:hypothetical protein
MNFLEKIKSSCAELSPDCREASRAQSEALDHRLPPVKRLGLWVHLLICKWCRRYGKQIRFLRDSAQAHQDELLRAGSHNLSNDVRERIKKRLCEKN